MAQALEHRGASREVIENSVQEAALRELGRLDRFLPTLSVLAAVAPLLGLLGTVSGMIETFQTIAEFGSGDVRLMSGGISEALLTTQLGLGVAIPVMLVHHLFERRADRLVADMEERGTAFSVSLLRGADEGGHG
jgi:biopolymer transport protein ExbB